MSSMDDLKYSIAQLEQTQRTALLAWLSDLEPATYEVRETAMEYGVEPTEPPSRHMTVEEYLEFEQRSQIRHEYLGGQIFAMSGATLRHNVIAQNMYSAFRSHLKGGPCRALIIDAKL